jgi:hypothetical protein
MRSHRRPFILGSALVITLTVPVTAGTPSDAELLAHMPQKVQKLQQQLHTTYTRGRSAWSSWRACSSSSRAARSHRGTRIPVQVLHRCRRAEYKGRTRRDAERGTRYVWSAVQTASEQILC